MKKLFLYLVVIGVVLPTTAVAVWFTVVGLVIAFDAIGDPNTAVSPLRLFFCIIFGDLGLASMWNLFLHYRANNTPPPRSSWHYCALMGGAAASFALVTGSSDIRLFHVLFFGWPVIGAVFFLGLLFMSRKAD